MMTFTESEVRAMRDEIYGQPPFGDPISDKGWEACKEKWMADADWLANHKSAGGSR